MKTSKVRLGNEYAEFMFLTAVCVDHNLLTINTIRTRHNAIRNTLQLSNSKHLSNHFLQNAYFRRMCVDEASILNDCERPILWGLTEPLSWDHKSQNCQMSLNWDESTSNPKGDVLIITPYVGNIKMRFTCGWGNMPSLQIYAPKFAW